MMNLWRDLRYGIRTLLKNPGFTAVAVTTLALGIGANTAIFSVVQNVLLRPLPYTEPAQLVEIYNTYFPHVPRGGLSPGDYADWTTQNQAFSEMGGYAEVSVGLNLTGDGDPQRVLAGYASASLFPMLGIQPAAGNFFGRELDRAGSAPVVILSHRLWQSRFGGDPSVVGRSIILDDRHFTVLGVLPPGFQLVRWADLWLPFGQYPDDLTEHVHHAFTAIARRKLGVSLEQARADIQRLNEQEALAYPDAHKNIGVVVQQLQDASAAALRRTLLIFFGAVGLVLLIACANIVNLLLVRNASREREIGLRVALGASPWQLVRQLLSESLLLSLAGGALGVLVAVIGLKILLAFVPADLAVIHNSGLNLRVLGFALAIGIAAGLFSGLLPSLRTLQTNLVDALKQGSKGSSAGGHGRTHNVLVVCEVALALIPLVGAGLLLRSFQHLLQVDPGFLPDHVLTLEVPQSTMSFEEYSKLTSAEKLALGPKYALLFEQISSQVRALPGVRQVGGIDTLPLTNELRRASRFVIEGQPIVGAAARPLAQTRTVSLGYFSALGIPLLAGRTFVQDDWKLQQNVVVNETMAKRYWSSEANALGKRINLCSLDPAPCWFSVVGVVGDVHQLNLESPQTCDVYFSGSWTDHLIVRAAVDPVTLVPAIATVIHKIDPTLPIARIFTMDAHLSESISPRRFSTILIGIFAGLALFLSAVGVYGVMSHTVSQRTQEIGIRMAMGAQRGEVQTMILAQSLKLTLLGVMLGFVGALALVRFLSALLFGVSAYDGVTFGCVALLLIGVALAASFVPARRAVRVDPIAALRSE